MLVSDARNIREVILFPQLRPEEGRDEIEHDEPAEESLAHDKPGGTAPR